MWSWMAVGCVTVWPAAAASGDSGGGLDGSE